MYTDIDYPSKKAVKDALAKGVKIRVYAPGLGTVPENGSVALEGPHYPKPHKWYGTGTMKDGVLAKIA